jgi:hypothetical protein
LKSAVARDGPSWADERLAARFLQKATSWLDRPLRNEKEPAVSRLEWRSFG